MSPTLEKTGASLRRHAPLVIAILIVGAIFAGIYFWRGVRLSSSVAYAAPPIEVLAQTVGFETLPQSLEATGSLSAVREVILAPEVSGRVIAISFEAGESVRTGSPVVHLYDAPERADRAAAVSRARFATLQSERSRELAFTGAEPRQLQQQREAELDQANAAIRQIDARIAQKTIRTPFGGRIGIRRVNLGQYVNAGDPLATLTALDRLYVNFSVPQQDLAKLSVGGQVVVRSDAYPGRVFPAQINAVEPRVSADTRNISVQAVLANPGQMLRPGLYVTASIAQKPRAAAIAVPATAIQTGASGDSVFVIRNGKAAVIPVVTGQRVGDRIVVDKGLRPGDSIVTSGQIRIQPGASVAIAKTPPAGASAAPASPR